MSEMEPIRCSVQITADDHINAYYLFKREQRKTRTIVLVVICLAALVGFLSYLADHTALSRNMVLTNLGFLALTQLWAWYEKWAIRRNFANLPTAGELDVLTFTDDGVHDQSPSIDHRYKWIMFTKALENELYFIVVTGNLYVIVPKRAFTVPDDIIRLRALIERQVPGFKPHTGKPMLPPPPPVGRQAE